ncbi:MAG: tyrosine--tRNA ligase [Verrucomicrobia bacterium]|nr:tyrosine--tRNA ligase [Verrucomicrobiota bacterium]
MTKNIITYLQERGFVDAITSEELKTACDKPIKLYCGFDPTAESLHLGNLIGIMVLAHFQRFGHTPVIVLGGATGRIGDPSGKSQERPLLDIEVIRSNINSIRTHFEQVLKFDGSLPRPEIVNNDDWFRKIGVIDFLRDIGKHFRLGPMLSKEMVRTRLESEEGMSFTEFSYQLIQGYDFYHLYSQHDVALQIGGSDQWGNIVSGIELTRKLSGKSVYGLTWPLLTRSDGKKFGKSEQGAIWLSAKLCSPYQFYQYLVRMPDADVIHMLKMLTFLELNEIAEIEKQMKAPGYVANTAQKRLAEEVTRIIHGEEGVEKALKATEAAAPGKEAVLDGAVLQEIAADMPSVSLSFSDVLNMRYADLAVAANLLPSKGEANRLLKNGGAYINNQQITDPNFAIRKEDLIDGQFLVVGAGKKKKVLVSLRDC